MREVQHAPADARNRAVGMDVVQAHDDVAQRLVDRYLEADLRSSENFDRLVQFAAVEDQRAGIVAALIGGHFPICPQRKEFATGGAGILGRTQGLFPGASRDIEQLAVWCEVIVARPRIRRRQSGLGDPAAGVALAV